MQVSRVFCRKHGQVSGSGGGRGAASEELGHTGKVSRQRNDPTLVLRGVLGAAWERPSRQNSEWDP